MQSYLKYVVHDPVFIAWSLIGERCTPYNQFEGQDTYLPNVASLIITFKRFVDLLPPAGDNLRGNIIHGPTKRRTKFGVLEDVTDAPQIA